MRRRHRQRKESVQTCQRELICCSLRSGDQRAYNEMLQAVRNNAPSERTCTLTQSQSSKYRGQIGAMEPPICWRVSHRSILGEKGEGECRQCCTAKVANLGQDKFCSGILDLGDINAHGRALAQSFKRDTGSGRDGPTRAAGSSDRRGAMDECRLA
jgi:hypothetical protein